MKELSEIDLINLRYNVTMDYFEDREVSYDLHLDVGKRLNASIDEEGFASFIESFSYIGGDWDYYSENHKIFATIKDRRITFYIAKKKSTYQNRYTLEKTYLIN